MTRALGCAALLPSPDEGHKLLTYRVPGELGIAVETARNHIRAILRRLHSHTRLEAVLRAHRVGLLS